MDHTTAYEPVGAIGERTKKLRRRKDWTAAELGKRMTELGVPWDRSIIANLENGRRKSVTVAELLALSIALDVAPVHLLIPPDAGRYRPAPAVEYDAEAVRAWVRGATPLPGTDERVFRSEVPLAELPVTASEGRLTGEGQSVRDRMRAEYKAATGRDLTADQLLNWMLRGERPEGMEDGEGV